MQAINTSKPFSVDVFIDGGAMDQSPWMWLGEFDCLSDAIRASKMVIDAHLIKRHSSSLCANQLAHEYLKQGPMPAINGAENLKDFDVYEYLDRRCYELNKSKWIHI